MTSRWVLRLARADRLRVGADASDDSLVRLVRELCCPWALLALSLLAACGGRTGDTAQGRDGSSDAAKPEITVGDYANCAHYFAMQADARYPDVVISCYRDGHFTEDQLAQAMAESLLKGSAMGKEAWTKSLKRSCQELGFTDLETRH